VVGPLPSRTAMHRPLAALVVVAACLALPAGVVAQTDNSGVDQYTEDIPDATGDPPPKPKPPKKKPPKNESTDTEAVTTAPTLAPEPVEPQAPAKKKKKTKKSADAKRAAKLARDTAPVPAKNVSASTLLASRQTGGVSSGLLILLLGTLAAAAVYAVARAVATRRG
jgi:outer membrane biosynthesis protein TonB